MDIDITLAGWILAVITFIVGTIVPTLYQRLYYEGISIKQLDIWASTQEPFEEKAGILVFSFLLKIANVKKDSILLDNVRTKIPSLKLNGVIFKQINTDLKLFDQNLTIYLPPSTAPDHRLDYFPVIIKADEIKIIGIGLKFSYIPKNVEDAINIFNEYIYTQGFSVSFRINGKYRDYRLRIQPDKKIPQSEQADLEELRNNLFKFRDGIVKLGLSPEYQIIVNGYTTAAIKEANKEEPEILKIKERFESAINTIKEVDANIKDIPELNEATKKILIDLAFRHPILL